MAITVAAWNNGDFNPSGAGYGLRLSETDRDALFRTSWREVVIHAPAEKGLQPVAVRLSPAFWKNCPELLSAVIGRWLIGRGHATWPTRRPPGRPELLRSPASAAGLETIQNFEDVIRLVDEASS